MSQTWHTTKENAIENSSLTPTRTSRLFWAEDRDGHGCHLCRLTSDLERLVPLDPRVTYDDLLHNGRYTPVPEENARIVDSLMSILYKVEGDSLKTGSWPRYPRTMVPIIIGGFTVSED